MEKARCLGKDGELSLATTLADELAIASRASRWARGVRWGTRILWGGVSVGALIWAFGADANAVGSVVLSSLVATCCVVFASLRNKRRTATAGTRSRALLAARRLERRFSERDGVWVAAVDFCCETSTGTGEDAPTSADLRGATVTLAARRLATLAAELDVVEWRAVLTEDEKELFRSPRKKTGVCVLGVLANLALGGSAVIGGIDVDEKGGAALAVVGVGEIERRGDEDKGNKEERKAEEDNANKEDSANELNSENKETAQVGGKSANKEGRDGEIDASVDDEMTAALEVLIFALAQSAEIAELLKAELESAVRVEGAEKEEKPVFSDATRFLQLARELNVNLTKPETGITTQVQRLNAAAQRGKMKVLERLERIGGAEKIARIGGEGDEEKNGEESGEKSGVAGEEIALLILASRLNKFEAKLKGAENQELATTFGLSAVLRSDVGAERAKALERAARLAGEWSATLRREAAAAQILSESWTFYTTSQNWKAANETAWRKNRALLVCFAGRSALGGAAANEKEVAFERAKEEFYNAWNESRSLENERFAVVERLARRLRNEEAQEFCATLAEEDGGFFGVERLRDDAWNAAAWNAINDAASRAEKRDLRVTEAVENNRFGRVAEELQVADERLNIEPPSTRRTANADKKTEETEVTEKKEEAKETEGSNETKESGAQGATEDVKETAEKTLTPNNKEVATELKDERRAADVRAKERRFAFLATCLTFGVDRETAKQTVAQIIAKETVNASGGEEKSEKAEAEAETEAETGKESGWATRQEAEARSAAPNESDNGNGALSQEVAETQNASEKNATSEVNDGKLSDYDDGEIGEKTREPMKEKYATSGDAESGSRNGAEANVGEAGGAGASDAFETTADGTQLDKNKAFNGELPFEARRRFEGTTAPDVLPEYSEKVRSYRRRIANERR